MPDQPTDDLTGRRMKSIRWGLVIATASTAVLVWYTSDVFFPRDSADPVTTGGIKAERKNEQQRRLSWRPLSFGRQ
jgi:hypothetical protein